MSTTPRRDEVLRTVIAAADERLDGVLPMDVPGIEATFRDEATLVSALHLRWHATLNAHVERTLAERPEDPEAAVARGWRESARELPGVRMVLDRWRAEATGRDLARAEHREARAHQWLAERAGLAEPSRQLDETSVRLGAEFEQRARTWYEPRPRSRAGLIQRLRHWWQ